MTTLPKNLDALHSQEEQLRAKSVGLVVQDAKLGLHLAVIEQAMNVCDMLRQFQTEDENLKVVQILGIRLFNAFGASLKLALSGYLQNSALILRDILETVFLLDLFSGDSSLITKWRFADAKVRHRDFSPAAVRKTLDDRYGHTTRKREELYKLFSELAGHPTMKSSWMMRPQRDGDAVIGPFIEKTSLDAVLSEMDRLAVQAGQHIIAFYPDAWKAAKEPRISFAETTRNWFLTFYPGASKP
jgi:hypothetical protein